MAMIVGSTRRKYFGGQVMREFAGDHDHAFGIDTIPLPVGGNPDMGCGVYSKQLSYKEWFWFNTL